MKSDRANLVQIKELLEEIHQLDQLISMHKEAGDGLMAKQYEARKRKFFDELVSLLLSSSPSTEMPPAFYIGQLMRHFYPQALEKPAAQSALENVLRPFVSV